MGFLLTLKHFVINLRPYSWADIVLLGFLAKFSTEESLSFAVSDLMAIAGLLCLWFFFNIILEAKHDYEYRARMKNSHAIPFLLAAIILGIANQLSIAFAITSVIFCVFYLNKKPYPIFGLLSPLTRGAIQASYFFYALSFFTSGVFSAKYIILGVVIFLVYAARAIVGDIRDSKHDLIARKITIPVKFGIKTAIAVSIFLIGIAAIILAINFHSALVALSLILFAAALLFYENGYVLHQLSVFKTSLLHVSLISLFTGQNMLFISLICAGVYLNMVFYPMLERKSNPEFSYDKT